MNSKPPEPTKKTKYPYCFVRLNPEQNNQLQSDAKQAGRSAAQLLRNGYFGKGRLVILMSDVDLNEVTAQINRIGNNVNQIAKKLNTGILFGFDQELSQVRILLSHLMTTLTSKYDQFKERKVR